MTTNLSVIANVKQLQTYVVLEFYCLFSENLGVLGSKIRQFLTVFTIGLSLARFWRAFRISGGFEPSKPPPSVHNCSFSVSDTFLSIPSLHFYPEDGGRTCYTLQPTYYIVSHIRSQSCLGVI